MAQLRRMHCQIEAKSPADKLYDAYRSKVHLMPKIASQVIKDVKLVEGVGLGSVGAVRHWTFICGGKCQTAKDSIEIGDDNNKTLVFKAIEGDILNYFKSWRSIFNITQMGTGSLVKVTMEYEKQNESVPDPDMYLEFMTICTKNLDAYLLNA